MSSTSPRIGSGGSVAPSPTHKPGFSRRPPWIRSAFETAVAQCEDHDSDGVPCVYSRDYTFWSRPTATYFNPKGQGPLPSALYGPEFFLWDVQALHKDLRCPRLGSGLGTSPRLCYLTIPATHWHQFALLGHWVSLLLPLPMQAP